MTPHLELPVQDLQYIQSLTAGIWDELRDSRIFITGGTGFFGRWLLGSIIWADAQLGLGAKVTLLTRDPKAFRLSMPLLASYPALSFLTGDVKSFAFPAGEFSHVIHGATESSTIKEDRTPLCIASTIVEGTRRVLEFSVRARTKKLLYISSGAVYGEIPAEVTHVPEEFAGGPSPSSPSSAYGESKRFGELLCAMYCQEYGLEAKVARCFAFVGPYLPLDAHYAIGNFIRDALAGGPIVIKGSGSAHRSYLYAADLAAWLWTILIRGRHSFPYNVGSEEDVTIEETARMVAEVSGAKTDVRIANETPSVNQRHRYVPSTKRARMDLHLKAGTPMSSAIDRTLRFHRHGTRSAYGEEK